MMEMTSMNCNSIKEAIDQSGRRGGLNETVRMHLGVCIDCRRHAEQLNSLLSLISAVPRVEAPADFDFRVRALIARSKTEPMEAKGLLEQFWSKSFSLGQTATALAAVAMAIFASTFYLTQSVEKTGAGDFAVATKSETPTPEPSASVPSAVFPSARSEAPASVKIPMTSNSARASNQVRVAGGARYQKSPGLQAVSLETTLSTADRSTRVYNRANGQVIHNRDFIGAEGVGAARPQTLALSF
jgi:hypothetical protein